MLWGYLHGEWGRNVECTVLWRRENLFRADIIFTEYLFYPALAVSDHYQIIRSGTKQNGTKCSIVHWIFIQNLPLFDWRVHFKRCLNQCSFGNLSNQDQTNLVHKDTAQKKDRICPNKSFRLTHHSHEQCRTKKETAVGLLKSHQDQKASANPAHVFPSSHLIRSLILAAANTATIPFR